MLKRYQSDFIAALLFALLPLILFWPVTLGDRTLIPADALTQYEPWRSAREQFGLSGPPHNELLSDLVLENYLWKKFILESLHAGELPLWNPYLFTGVPFLAAGQHSALYPFSIIYYLIPLPRAYGWFTVSQLWMAGVFAFVFLRVLGLRRVSAVFGGVLYQLCGFMLVSVVFQMIIAAAAWLPLILAFIELMARQQPLAGRPATVPWMVCGAFALGAQILAGHVEITYYTLMVAGAYSLWRLADIYRKDRKGRKEHEQRSFAVFAPFAVQKTLRPALAMLGLAVFGVALAAVQFVPLYELASSSFRTGRATFDQILGWAYPWRHAIVFLIPNFYGNPSHHAYFDLFSLQWVAAPLNNATIDWGMKNYVEGGTYLGILPLLLSVVAVITWARSFRTQSFNSPISPSFYRTVPFFALLAFLALAFAFPTRLYALIFWLPGINQLHSAFRWVWPLALSVAVLSAFGLEVLLESRVKRIGGLEIGRWMGNAALIAGGLTLVALVSAYFGYERIAGLMDRAVSELALAERAFTDGRMFFSYTAPWVALFAVLTIVSGIVLRLRDPRALGPAAVGVLALDLLIAGWGFNPAADPKLLDYLPPSAQFLKQDESLWRFTSYDPKGEQRPYHANVGWFFNFQDVRGYDSLFSRQYADYMETIEPQPGLLDNRISPIRNIESLNSPLLDLLNVKYVITQDEIPNNKYTLVYDGEVKIYRNETVLPRAYVLPQTATLAVDIFRLAAQQFDARRFVMVAPADSLGAGFAPPEFALEAAPAPVADIRYSPNEVFVDAAVTEPSWLILNDAYEAGWKAFVRPRGGAESDERELRIALVNGNSRGVTLAPGEWTVRFRYTPVSVRLGAIGSLTAGVTLLFLLGVWAWRLFYHESKIDSTARRIAKNSLAPMALNLVNRAIDLMFAAFMLRVLGPAEAGKYYYAIVIFGWFEIVTNYGLNTFLTREVSRDRAHANRYLVNTTVLRLLLGLVAIPGLALILAGFYFLPALPFLGPLEPLTADVLWAIGLLVLAQAPATVSTGLSALFYAYEKAEYPAAVATVTTLVKVTLGVIALVLGYGFVGLAATSLIVNVVTLAVLGALASRVLRVADLSPRMLDWRLQRNAVRESFPLMLNNLLATLFFKVDVTLLQPLRGPTEVGWYSTGYKYVDAYNIVPSLFTFALFPVLSRQAHDPEQRAALRFTYGFAVKLLVAVALPLAAVTAFLAPLMIGLLGGAEYLPAGAVALVILAWSMPFGWINSVTNYVLIALGQQRALTNAFAAAVIFNVVLNLIFIPQYGFAAAAAITIASEIFEGAFFYLYLRRSLGDVPWLRLLWRPWLSVGMMLGGMALLWPVNELLALAVGAALYLGGLVLLRAFTTEERATLLSILPGRVRERLKPPAR